MSDCSNNKLPIKYAYRFGQIAINMGFVNEGQVDEALAKQIALNSSTRLRPQKFIGEILFENGWITFDQIEKVLKEISFILLSSTLMKTSMISPHVGFPTLPTAS